MKEKISVCIISFNEEENIGECLESVKWADEIVVIDSKSTDRTFEICKAYTDHVYSQEWMGHVEQKNRCIDLASNPWILNLDADERVTEALANEIQEAIKRCGNEVNGFYIPRHTFYLGKWIDHGGWYPDYKLRLFKKGKGRFQGMNPHDKVWGEGKNLFLKNYLIHYTYKDISHHIHVIDRYSEIFVDEMMKRGKGRAILLQMIFRPLVRFLKMYFVKRGFLDGLPGFIIAVNTSFYVFTKYSKLWEGIRLKAPRTR